MHLLLRYCWLWLSWNCPSYEHNRISGVMVSVLASSVVDRGFEPLSGQTKDYEIGICCFSAKHTALRRKSKDWFARNQDNVSKWGDMFICGLLLQWASTIKSNLMCWSSTKRSLSSHGMYLFLSLYGLEISHLLLNNNHSLTQHKYTVQPVYIDHWREFWIKVA